MKIILTAAVILFSVIYFILDKSGKIDRNGIGRGIVYISMPFLAAVIVCITSAPSIADITNMDAGSIIDLDEQITNDFFAPVLASVLQMVVLIPTVIIAAVGCVSCIKNEVKTDNSIAFGNDGIINGKRLVKLSFAGSIISAVSGIAGIVFAGIAVVYSFESVMTNLFAFIMAMFFLTLMTFGIGLIIVIIFVPLYALSLGAAVITACLSFILSSCAFGCAFGIIHVFSAAFAIFGVKKLCSEGFLTKKSAILYGIASAIPVVNIFTSANLCKMLKQSAV